MKKILTVVLIFTIILNFSSGCYLWDNNKEPDVSIKIIDHTSDNYLEWIIENKDKTNSITFNKGNIFMYSIRHIETHKIYESKSSDNTLTLKPGESYTTKLRLDFLNEKGEYEGTFYAKSNDNTYKMIFNFKK